MGIDKMQTLYIVQTPQHIINTVSTQCQHSVKFQDFDVNTMSTVDTVLIFLLLLFCDLLTFFNDPDHN